MYFYLQVFPTIVLKEGSTMGEEFAVARAKVVVPWFASCAACEAVARTFAMTEAQPLTGAAGGGEAAHLVEAKLRLSLSAHHFRDAGIADIAQTILGKDEMVATVQVATGFDDRRVVSRLSRTARVGSTVHLLEYREATP